MRGVMPRAGFVSGRYAAAPDDYSGLTAGGNAVAGFACATASRSVQTSESALISGIGAGLGCIGRLAAANSLGLWLDDAVDNVLALAGQRNIGGLSWTGGQGGLITGPDGTAGARRVNIAAGGNSGGYNPGSAPADQRRAVSAWVRANSGTTEFQLYCSSQALYMAALSATWQRVGLTFTTAANTVLIGDGRDMSASGFNIPGGGKPTTLQDYQIDFLQYSSGRLYHGQWFAGSACAAQTLTKSTVLDGGRWGVRFKLYLPCALASLTVVTPYLFYVDANNYASINPSTRVITLCIGGTSITCAALGSDPGAGGLLDVYIACGGSLPTVVEASINGGAWANLFLSTVLANPGFASYQVTKGLGCFLVEHAQYQRGRGPDNGIYYVDLANTAKDFSDSQTTSNWFGAPVARGQMTFDTTATALAVVKDSTMANADKLGISVDGAVTQVANTSGLAATSLTPAAGAHEVVLIDGEGDYGPPVASRPPSAYWSFARANAPMVRRAVAKRLTSRALFVLGDSTMTRAATNNVTESIGCLLRANFPGDVLIHANGGDRLSQYYASADLVNEVKRRLAGYTKPELLILLGYNDGAAGVSAADYASEYGSLLDAIKAAVPALVRAWCVSPLTATTAVEAAKLVDYRTQLATVVAARAWCTLISGPASCDAANLTDQVHYNTAGHAQQLAYWRDATRMNF